MAATKVFVPKPSQELGFQTICLIHNRRSSVLVHTNRGGDKNKRSQKLLLCLHLLRLPASFSGSLRECFTRALSKRQVILIENIVPIREAFERSAPIKSINYREGTLAACEGVSQEPSQRRQVMGKKRLGEHPLRMKEWTRKLP